MDTLKENGGVTFPTLPVAGVTVIGVTGVRSKRINRQVLLQFEMGEQLFEHAFLVIKVLNLDLILGNDFLSRHQVVIDYKIKRISIQNNDHEVHVEFENTGSKERVHKVRICKGSLGRGCNVDDVLGVFASSKELVKEDEDILWERRKQFFRGKGEYRC